LLGSEDQLHHTDARLEALYRRYKNRHYAKEQTKRIGLHPSEVDHSMLTDEWQATEMSMGTGGESNLDMIYELGQQYAISVR
jgi:exonuclease I